MDFDESHYLKILEEDSGDPVFAEYAEHLRREGRPLEALNVCLKGLSGNPSCHKGRLALARVFYEQEYFPFARRELEQLAQELPENQSLKRLLEKFSIEAAAAESKKGFKGSQGGMSEDDSVVAEADFDFECLDLLDEDEE